MQVLVFLILVFATISSVLAAAFIGFYGDPAYPGKCVLNDLILSPGDVHYDIKKCERTSCEDKSMASFYSCGVFQPPVGCKLGDRMHPLAPYPDCCEHHVLCNND